MLRKFMVILLLMAGSNSVLQAQFVSGKNELGLNLGALIYQGDLSPKMAGSVKTARPMLGIYYNRILTNYWSFRANLTIGSLRGDDSRFDTPEYMRHRNFNFSTRLTELSVMGVYNIYGNNDNFRKFSTYLFAGAGLSFLMVKRDYSRLDTAYFSGSVKLANGLATDSAARLPGIIPVIPMGIGVKYAILPRISLVVEGMYRYTFTDYLDGFSYAANPKLKDSYYSVSIGAVFNFGKDKMACPTNFKWDR
ncbi:MAG: DUF6089 family protein [Chitinophagaceae bacterium]